jgi:hypothetical protein
MITLKDAERPLSVDISNKQTTFVNRVSEVLYKKIGGSLAKWAHGSRSAVTDNAKTS